MKILLLAFLFLILYYPLAHSSDHLKWNKNRPIQIEDAYSEKRGDLVFQQGLHLQKNKRGESALDLISEIIYGINDHMHIGVEGKYRFVDLEEKKHKDGFGDTKFTLLYNFYGDKEELQGLSVKGEISIPTANTPRSTKGIDFSLTILASKVYEQWGFHANLSFTRIGHVPLRDYTYLYGVAADYALRPKITLLGNIYVERTPWQGEKLLATIEGGVLYQVNKRLVLDTSVGTGLRDVGSNLDISWASGFSLIF